VLVVPRAVPGAADVCRRQIRLAGRHVEHDQARNLVRVPTRVARRA
jgi:hypothetical protein